MADVKKVIPIDELRPMYESGTPIAQIMEKYGITVSYLYRFLRSHSVPLRPRGGKHMGVVGAGNHMWKGNKASYHALHARIRNSRGDANYCELCGKNDTGWYDWANLNGSYTKVEDYASMCRSCHRRYDHMRSVVGGTLESYGYDPKKGEAWIRVSGKRVILPRTVSKGITIAERRAA